MKIIGIATLLILIILALMAYKAGFFDRQEEDYRFMTRCEVRGGTLF